MSGKIIIKSTKLKEIEKIADEWYEKLMRGEDVVITYKDRDVFEVFLSKYKNKDIKIIDDQRREYDITEVDTAVNMIGVDFFVERGDKE